MSAGWNECMTGSWCKRSTSGNSVSAGQTLKQIADWTAHKRPGMVSCVRIVLMKPARFSS